MSESKPVITKVAVSEIVAAEDAETIEFSFGGETADGDHTHLIISINDRPVAFTHDEVAALLRCIDLKYKERSARIAQIAERQREQTAVAAAAAPLHPDLDEGVVQRALDTLRSPEMDMRQ